MSSERRAVRTLVVVAVLMVPLAVASVAYACARLATLKLDRSGGAAGAQVEAVGRNFSNEASSSPVALRFNSRNGRVLWEGRADRQGKVAGTFRVPKARAGHYVIVATQQTAEGRPAAGTPGRAPLTVRGARRSSASAPPALPPVSGGVPGSPDGGLPLAPTVLVPLLLLGAFAGAAVAVGRRRSGALARA